jgi:hypothetical protein
MFASGPTMARHIALYLILATVALLASAQSVDPGIGINPEAQGGTEDVTPGAGPNG